MHNGVHKDNSSILICDYTILMLQPYWRILTSVCLCGYIAMSGRASLGAWQASQKRKAKENLPGMTDEQAIVGATNGCQCMYI
jgi:hypothetical protein